MNLPWQATCSPFMQLILTLDTCQEVDSCPQIYDETNQTLIQTSQNPYWLYSHSLQTSSRDTVKMWKKPEKVLNRENACANPANRLKQLKRSFLWSIARVKAETSKGATVSMQIFLSHVCAAATHVSFCIPLFPLFSRALLLPFLSHCCNGQWNCL